MAESAGDLRTAVGAGANVAEEEEEEEAEEEEEEAAEEAAEGGEEEVGLGVAAIVAACGAVWCVSCAL